MVLTDDEQGALGSVLQHELTWGFGKGGGHEKESVFLLNKDATCFQVDLYPKGTFIAAKTIATASNHY